MLVRLRFGRGPQISRRRGKNRHVAFTAAALMRPVSLMAYVFGVWRLASDAGLVGAFVPGGVFSHWQVWMALGGSIQVMAVALNRYGMGGELLQRPRLLELDFRAGPPLLEAPKSQSAAAGR